MGVKSYRSTGGNILITLILAAVAVFMALPLVYTITMAFKPLDELFLFPPRFFVRRPTFKNFTDLFSLMGNSYVPFSRYIFNSLFISIVGTVGHVLLASMAAYPLAKHRFPGSNLLFNIIVFSLMFSAYVTNIPRFMVLSGLGWLNDYKALIFPMMSSTLGLYLMRQFMEQIPDSLLESAKVDGANELTTWWRIVMPMVKPAWLTLTLLAFKDFWNDSNSPALYIHTESLKTLPLALSYVQAGGLARAGASAAVGLLMMLPPILIFILTQSNVIETMKTSGLKE
ncbi:carbohydrate ABC transporter permease [Mahella australiensis]|uniref:Carbohydrate ABC transporter membrane protein 2, CUT1 family n=1 Tax=Mahella australiensis (strain DSM 15567 / CIP 107919 / 50-1 BON) TaxID=697281 RepID=F4A0T4_MAHA5|nr:carbohydrate ABC transporter permease [Mahella australiensis]AEE96980.1 carbohydrate ABC transporter membrane protein 2, CUT1 family [Mahella australiensis 50-1 BON]